jgi:hypothetical protein
MGMHAPKQSMGSIAAVAVFPHPPVVITIAGRSYCLDSLCRAMQAQLYSDGIRTSQIRVARVYEEPRRLRLAARSPSPSSRRRG